MLPWRRARPVVWCLILLGVPALLAAGCRAADSDATTADAGAGAGPVDPDALFIGTWRLARTDRYDQRGEPLSHLMHPTVGLAEVLGYLMYDGERVGMIMQEAGRSSDDIRAAVEGYMASFGTYDVHEAQGDVTHRLAGSLNPRRTGEAPELFYEFSGDQLILTPALQCPDSYVTDSGCSYGTTGVQLQYVWERVPPVNQTDPDAGRFYGFWALDRFERHTPEGAAVPVAQYADGYLAYMPSGHMAVQLMRADRQPYEGVRPTAPEADAAFRSYLSYFGSFSLQADDAVVVHHRAGHLDPEQVGTDAHRRFQFRDGQLVLQPPVSTDAEGREGQTSVFWNRLSTLDPAAGTN